MKKNHKNTFLKIKHLILLVALFNIQSMKSQTCTAAFTPSGCVSGTMQFWNTSTGTTSNTHYSWTFGDGGNAITMNPSHTYTANGIYNVCLTLIDSVAGCFSTKCHTVNINCVTASSCMAAFNSFSCVAGTKWFSSTSTGTTSLTNYSWTFGDGGTAFIKNPSHTYTANGIYNVCLTIQDSTTGCMSTKCQTVNINCVTTPSCMAAFNSFSCVAGTKWFSSTSTGTTSLTNYSWTFGDGGTAFIKNPSHTYTANGIYNVCLTIQDSTTGCMSTKCQTVNINCVTTPSCMAAFNSYSCVAGTKWFTSTSTGTTSTTNYSWTFGDGGTAFIKNPSHTYTANGIYNVCLTIQDSATGCMSTKCQTVNINCISTSSTCMAAFTPSGCVGGNMQFWNTSTGITALTNYTWTFGDGGSAFTQNASHTYTANGIYNVCLTIKDSLCTSTKCQTVNVNCVSTGSCMAAFNSYSCVAGTVYFVSTSTGTTALTNYSWTFGDGGTASIKNPSHTYTVNGVYNVCLTIKDSLTSCMSTSCKTVNVNCALSSVSENTGNSLLIKVLPNPNNGYFNLVIDKMQMESKTIEVFIYNVLGEEVYRSKEEVVSGTLNKPIDLTSIADGAYFVRLSTGTTIYSKKIIINK